MRTAALVWARANVQILHAKLPDQIDNFGIFPNLQFYRLRRCIALAEGGVQLLHRTLSAVSQVEPEVPQSDTPCGAFVGSIS